MKKKHFLTIPLSVYLLLLLMTASSTKIHAQDTLYYVGDPMCSWCYGFSPEMEKIKSYCAENQITFVLIVGGLRPHGQETMGQLKTFLKHHWKEVNKRTGQPFHYEILDQTDMKYDTEPACRAVKTIGKLKPGYELEFFTRVQQAFYLENKNTNQTETYAEIAKLMNIDSLDFITAFESYELKTRTEQDFQFAASIGITGFPSLVLKTNQGFIAISRGYDTSENVIAKLTKIREKKSDSISK